MKKFEFNKIVFSVVDRNDRAGKRASLFFCS